jgi:hypothetical protein
VLALVVADRAKHVVERLHVHAPAARLARGLEGVEQVLVGRVVVELGRARRGQPPQRLLVLLGKLRVLRFSKRRVIGGRSFGQWVGFGTRLCVFG